MGRHQASGLSVLQGVDVVDLRRVARIRTDGAATFPYQGPYLERFWLPILGPAATYVLKQLDRRLEDPHGEASGSIAMLAAEVGVHPTKWRSSVDRLVRFRLASVDGSAVNVPATVIEVSERIATSLPPHRRLEWGKWRSQAHRSRA